MQKPLLSAPLPPGHYRGISFIIIKVSMVTEDEEIALTPPAEPVRLDHDFILYRHEAVALFIDSMDTFTVTGDSHFTPNFALISPIIPTRNYLGFISNTRNNIVTVFNEFSMEIIGVIGTGTGPKGMVLDQQKGILYVANAGDDSIDVISVDSLEVTGKINLFAGSEPVDLALAYDGNMLLSANYGSSSISLLDTRSLSETAKVMLEPVRPESRPERKMELRMSCIP